MEKEKHIASESMKKFFAKLLELKKYVKEKHELSKDKVLKEILDKLDNIIKEGK